MKNPPAPDRWQSGRLRQIANLLTGIFARPRVRIPPCPPIGLALLLLAAFLPSCVTRTLYVDSDPQGAQVFLDGRQVGVTPYAEEFDYYGVRRLELRHPGQVRLLTELDIERPWWQIFPISVVSDLLVPIPMKDRHSFLFVLESVSDVPMGWEQADEVYARLEALRQRLAELEATDP